MKRLRACFVGAVVLLPSLAGATTVRLYSEPEMVQAAAAIVHGTVAAVSPRLEKGLIVTDVVIATDDVWKGPAKQRAVTFVQLGGTLGGRTTSVPGQSVYRVGEEVVVFLEAGGGGLVEMGIGAGKYAVDRAGGTPMVERRLGGVGFAQVTGKKATPVGPPKVMGPEPLATFKARVVGELGR